uniref:DnaJ homolog subfamily C member 17 n=1 Tax=Crassostrea virginica TaxID=6565 RepID=A0A8B8DNS4_CRAVI|nr:dnaJ homolog subfamily C member 17-like [Crassostrea virginica]XP_022329846.1 dnaJ homolog subfamily C member 17-like [Crassostrea virginica]XP_022329847.1 dnaJ homolog subfamily C member 17-like [Crassostrea virginica]
MSGDTVDILKLDLYGILGVKEDATEKEIVKSYRKQALKCHPDKNPDDPKAAELFHQLAKALEILTDAAAKAAYDKAQKAKKAAEARHRELDSKRKKFKEDLESREKAANVRIEADLTLKKNLQAEIERLRKEGSKLLEEEQERLKEEIREGQTRLQQQDETENDNSVSETPKLKVKWKCKKNDETNGGYNSEILTDLFSKYGDILNLIMSKKKGGSAIVEFRSWTNAENAKELEKGLMTNPLSLSWIQPPPLQPQQSTRVQTNSESQHTPSNSATFTNNEYSSHMPSDTSSARDFESLVLHKLRQAEERKRLIEQMQKEDEEG